MLLPDNNRKFQTEATTFNQSNNTANPLNFSHLVMNSNSYVNSPIQGTEDNLNTVNDNLSNQDFVIYSNNSNDSNDLFGQLGNGLNLTGLSERQQPQSVLDSPIYAYTASTTPAVITLDDFNFHPLNNDINLFDTADADPCHKYINFANLEDQQLTDSISYSNQHTADYQQSSPHPQAQGEVDQILFKNILDILSAQSTPASIADPIFSPAQTVYSNFESSPLVGSFTPELAQVHSQVGTPHTQYIGSPLLTNLNQYFSPIVPSQSPQVPPQTPISYHSDVTSTAPSTAVNTPFTTTIPYFDDVLDSPLFESAPTPVPPFDHITFPSNIFRSIAKHKLPSKPLTSDSKLLYPNFLDIAPQPTIVAMASVKPSTETEKNANGNNTDAPKNGTTQENATIAPSAITVAPVAESAVQTPPPAETSDTSSKGASGTTSADSATNNTSSSRPVPILPRPEESSTDVSESNNAETVESEPARKRRKSETGSADASDPEDNEHNAEGKTYSCPKCGRQFGRKFNMQTHVATHDPNRVKPFSCDFPGCGSRFTRKHDLKRHINGIHKGEKVHECNVCQKPFSRKDAWKRHQASCGKN